MSKPGDSLEPIRIRAKVEEANSNVFVENFYYNAKDDLRMLWIRFFSEGSTPEGVIAQVQTISADFDIQLLVFAVGRSYYISYSETLKDFYRVKHWKGAVPILEEMDKLRIPTHKVRSKIRNMFLEDRWRKLLDDNHIEDAHKAPKGANDTPGASKPGFNG